jgi:hypothetical protein
MWHKRDEAMVPVLLDQLMRQIRARSRLFARYYYEQEPIAVGGLKLRTCTNSVGTSFWVLPISRCRTRSGRGLQNRRSLSAGNV